ncbi:lysine-specific permease [Geranomyces variabilis]|nr:lysine-specific permease [Geranomyces variabilis]
MSDSTIEKRHSAIPVDGQAKEENLEKGIKRQMKSRHIAMISIGGTIGTGLFVASGGPIYVRFMGFTLFGVMTALGEMATLIPITGSCNHYAGRFVDPAFGFAMYWNYFFGFGTCLATELAASGVIIGYWKKVVPENVWSLLILVLIVFFNMFGGRGYGEKEYWLSLIKIVTVVIFIIVGTLVAAGALGGHTYGFENWTNPGAFVSDGPDVYSNAFANICNRWPSPKQLGYTDQW